MPDCDSDSGGEQACWLERVCIACGAVDGHRPGCELAEASDALVMGEPDARRLFELPPQRQSVDE